MSWDEAAACKRYDPELWHPQAPKNDKIARGICVEECIVTRECLEYALRLRDAQGPIYGVWAGLPNNTLVNGHTAARIKRAAALQWASR